MFKLNLEHIMALEYKLPYIATYFLFFDCFLQALLLLWLILCCIAGLALIIQSYMYDLILK